MIRTIKLLRIPRIPIPFPRRKLICAALLMNITLGVIMGMRALVHATQADVTVEVNLSSPLQVSRLQLGYVNSNNTLDPWGNPAAIASGRALLQEAVIYQVQSIHGAGVGPINESPGVYDWSTLDRRIQLATELGRIPIIALWGAPTWMTDPNWTGGTNWDLVNAAPLPEHEADFANLAQRIAQRYTNVQYFEVWAEMKGMYDRDLQRWSYERYTRLYNLVYDAIKTIRPDAKFIGPYVRIDHWVNPLDETISNLVGPYGTIDRRSLDVVTYWLVNKHGGDIVGIDGGINAKDNLMATDIFTATQKFADVNAWLRQQTDLPIWWTESYVHTISGDPSSIDPAMQPAAIATMLAQHALSGTSLACGWSPQQQPNRPNSQNLFTDTLLASGGQPLANQAVYRDFGRFFGPGTQFYKSAASSPSGILVLASAAQTMIVNQTDVVMRVQFGTELVVLDPYQVVFTATPPDGGSIRPAVGITYPTKATPVYPKTLVTIVATAEDNVEVQKVDFFVNNKLVCTRTSGPYTCDWNVPAGTGINYTIRARAVDAVGNIKNVQVAVTTK